MKVYSEIDLYNIKKNPQKQHLKDRVYIVYSEVNLNKMFTSIITTNINILDVINSCTFKIANAIYGRSE